MSKMLFSHSELEQMISSKVLVVICLVNRVSRSAHPAFERCDHLARDHNHGCEIQFVRACVEDVDGPLLIKWGVDYESLPCWLICFGAKPSQMIYEAKITWDNFCRMLDEARNGFMTAPRGQP